MIVSTATHPGWLNCEIVGFRTFLRWEFRLATGAQHVLTWALRAEEETAATPVRVPAPPTVARDQVETRRAELRETYSRWRTECSRWKSDARCSACAHCTATATRNDFTSAL